MSSSSRVSRFGAGLGLLAVTLLVGCDGASKYAAEAQLPVLGAQHLLRRGVAFDLVYTENHDTAFTLLRHLAWPGKPEFLAAIACLATAALVAMWWKRRPVASKTEHAAFAFTLSGALGNAVDRITRGFVVDFVHVHAGWFDWPVFNLADVFVVVGAVLFVLASRSTKARALVTSGG